MPGFMHRQETSSHSSEQETLLNFNILSKRKVKPILQAEAAECGLSCLAMVFSFHGRPTTMAELREKYSLSLGGSRLQDLMALAASLGFKARPIKVELRDVRKLSNPCILHWDMSHFVVLSGVDGIIKPKYRIIDPASGESTLTSAELSKHYTGVALELQPITRFINNNIVTRLKITQLWSGAIGLKTNVFQLIILSTLMQLMAFAAPLYLQTAVDTALPTLDVDLLKALAVGFTGLVVLTSLTTYLRDLIMIRFNNLLGFQIISNLMNHLMRLPISYFEKRHPGDIISRFESSQPLIDMLTRGFMSAAIDGVMGLFSLLIMLIYSAKLGLVACSAISMLLAARLLYYKTLKNANVSSLSAKALESTTSIETILGLTTIRIFGRESDRLGLWQNIHAKVVNSNIKISRINILFELLSSLIVGIENIVIVFLAIKQVIDGSISLGMVFAFQAYRLQFEGAAGRLIGEFIQYKMLQVHLDRVGDIVLSPAETKPDKALVMQRRPIEGRITIRNLVYSFSSNVAPILNGVDLTIEPGECVAIIGGSGSGKTTLLKLMMGLYKPNSGTIEIDGISLFNVNNPLSRQEIGAVSQNDYLYSGSIAENIAFFDSSIDLKRVYQSAVTACIHEEIMNMVMGYDSLVSSMGSTLSGGQKQRVLLARALYHNPKILFLDEATAHLDHVTDRKVCQSLSTLGITRVVVAHRPETIGLADKVFALNQGKVECLRRQASC